MVEIKLILIFLVLVNVYGLERRYEGTNGIYDYMKNYGYLNQTSNQMSLVDLNFAILKLQKQLGLKETGELDGDTVEIINTPRCTNNDGYKNTSSEKYTIHGTKWDKQIITYRIKRYSSQRISQEFTRETIRRAFGVWERHVELWFQHSEDHKVDIEIEFTHGSHGDSFPFEHQTSQLAHAFYPGTGLGGDIHFNDAVDWSQRNILYFTAIHEIGHSLGLRHSSHQDSIMFPHLIQDTKSDARLHEDDIAGIQAIYKARTFFQGVSPSTTTGRPHFENPTNNLLKGHPICNDGRIDTIISTSDTEILVFRDNEVITLQKMTTGMEVTKVESIKDAFKGRLPNNIDAAFTNQHKKTFYFKGDLYWRFSGHTIDEGYPKLLKRNFNGIPDNIEATFESHYGRIYFFKGSKFWKFESRGLKEGVDFDIARNWKGIPNNRIDASLQLKNSPMFVFFFQNGRYWKYNHNTRQVEENGNYPRDVRVWWFGCTEFRPTFDEL